MSIKQYFIWLPFAAFFVTLATFVLPCRFRVRGQAVWAMVLLAAFSMFLCFASLGGDAFNPILPEKVIWIWNWAYSGALILMLLSFGWQIARLVFRGIRGRFPPDGRLALPVLAGALSAFGMYNGIRPPEPVAREFASPLVPPELDGYRILQISDLHASSAARRWRTECVVERANAARPDLIVLTGDLADGYPSDRWRDLAPLARLRARDGVFAVTGNHEFYFDWNGWRDLYESWGIRFLQNECVFPHAALALGGVNDKACWNVRAAPDPDVGRTFRAATNGEFRVLLQHRPAGARGHIAHTGVNLQLSGHTHGGVMPLMTRLVARYNDGMVRSWYDFGTGRVYVSPGAGQWAGFPMRFFDPVEMAVITLRRK